MEEFYRDFDWELDRFVEYRFVVKKNHIIARVKKTFDIQSTQNHLEDFCDCIYVL
jgi:hypothetical protein